MLHCIQSNRLERLLDRLRELLDHPGDDPLRPVEIVVQNPGMGRWIAQQLALRRGIAANLRFPLPARFAWEIFHRQLGLAADETGYDREVLRWRALELFPSLLGDPSFRQVAGYLADDDDGIKAYHLAGKVADLFDQYLVYRPDMLLQWEEDGAGDWQARLWREVAGAAGPHRASHLREFRAMVRKNSLDPSLLPPRVFLFGISSLAPVYLEIIHAVAARTEVYLFHLSPCREYWGDIVSEKERARKRTLQSQPESAGADYLEAGNPLLASLGGLGRDFFSQLLELEPLEEEVYDEPGGESLLASLQSDILALTDRTLPDVDKGVVRADDRSLRLHSCHSRMREVQILHDRLLELFAADPELKPGEILVMAPDIEQYGAAVTTVFGGAEKELFIPWSLADRSLRGEDPQAEALLALLELCSGICTASGVLDLLERQPVMLRFGLDAGGVARIRRWTRESGIRWGLDATHRKEAGSHPDQEHTWAFGLGRLFMGYWTGETDGLVHGVSPCGRFSMEEAVLLGRLADFVERLGAARGELSGERTAEEWSALLVRIMDDFLAGEPGEEDEQALVSLREVVGGLAASAERGGFTGRLSFPVVRAWLEETLSGPGGGQGFLSGRVTFCNMVPLRSVPFPVVCLLGMNDTEFPRAQPRIDFDRMAADPKPGDRNRRDDDRYLFLEAILSARKVLYVSWVGRDQRDNSERPVSVVVGELLDYLERGYVDEQGNPWKPPVVEHPLQPFSRKCYDGTPGLASYRRRWLPGTPHAKGTLFCPGPLPEGAGEDEVDLADLVRFWSAPVRAFLEHRLEMEVRERDETLEDSEPFVPDHLERYLLTQRCLESLLRGMEAGHLRDLLRAEGLLPHSFFGDNLFSALLAKARELIPLVRPYLERPAPPLDIECAVGAFRIRGRLDNLTGEGCLRYRAAKRKGKDLVQLWVEHLALNLAARQGPRTSILVTTDKSTFLRPVTDPGPFLERLLLLRRQGLQDPLHFYPETSLAWFSAGDGKKERKAREAWEGNFNRNGEGEREEYEIGLRGAEPLDETFRELAGEVYGPLLAHMEEEDAPL